MIAFVGQFPKKTSVEMPLDMTGVVHNFKAGRNQAAFLVVKLHYGDAGEIGAERRDDKGKRRVKQVGKDYALEAPA